MIKKNPTAKGNRGSLKKSKLNHDLDLLLGFFSFSGFLNELLLNVFSAIVNLP